LPGAKYRIAGTLENASRIMNNTFWIGVWPGLSQEMLDFTTMNIRQFIGDGA